MRKILASLASLTLSVTTATTLISCNADWLKTPQPSILIDDHYKKIDTNFHIEVDLQGIRNWNVKANSPSIVMTKVGNPNNSNPVYRVYGTQVGSYIISLSGELRFIEYYWRFGFRRHRWIWEYREDFTNILVHIQY